jgi:predicted ATPase
MLATVGGDQAAAIRTPDQRVRVFVSSTLQELAEERGAVRDAVKALRLVPVIAAVSAAELMPAAIAAGLGLNTSGGRLLIDVVSYLRSKRLLLVLDNFEQVTEAAPVVAELLAAAPGLVTLVTSRTVLRVSGEFELCVPPLAVPPFRDAGNLDDYASVRLFMARAGAAAPGFELTGRNAQAVAEICRRLDGLPLAIELAAARIRLLPPAALLARLDDQMSVLTAGPRDLPERQRTLRNTLDWSFGLLSADEQALFARLGVFAGTFGLPAAEAVCGDPSTPAGHPGRTMDTLSSLVDSSLVRPEPREDEPRFSLLEPSGCTPWSGCARAATGRRCTTGMPPTSCPWPSRPTPSFTAPGSWPG